MTQYRTLQILLALCLLYSTISPLHAEQKRVYIALDDHTDYMWTADEATYQQVFLTSLDYYLDQADATQSNPTEYQSRFNTDGSFWLWTYEKNRSSTEFDRLMSRVKSGHIGVPLNALVSTYGATPAEAVLRGMLYPGQLERRYDVRFSLVESMENQTLPYGVGALWAGAGAKYSWRGICGCVSQVPTAWDREHDVYWWTGADGSRILMKWNSMLTGNNASMGGYAEARDTANVITYVDTNSAFLSRWPYPVVGAFGYGWDDQQTLLSTFPTIAQSMTTTTRKVIVSNEEDFFVDLEATSGSILPSKGVSFGNEWDLYSASLAETTSSVKRSVEKLRAAEGMATLVSIEDPTFLSGRTSARDMAMMNLGLYWEHDWTADGPVSRDARRDWQRRTATNINNYVNTLHDDAAKALAAQIQTSGTNTRFFVYNPLSWERNDVAELVWTGTTPVHVVEVQSGLEVPSQLITRSGTTVLQIWAQTVPSLGYRVYEVRSGTGQSYSAAASVTGGTTSESTLENATYRITFTARGAITSLIDKTRGNRELASVVNGRAINDLGSGTGTLTLESTGPVSVTLKAVSSSPLAHTSRLTLYRSGDRIDLKNELTQNFSTVLTWGFGFNLSQPEVHHEEIGAIVKAKLSTQGGIYSPRNARYDWLSLQHFADMRDSVNGHGVTLSNADLSFMKLGNSTVSSLDTNTAQLSVLAGGQVDGTNLGIQNQGGDSYFLQRFALRTHGAYDATAAMRFALEHQNPLVTALITGGTAYPETAYSLAQVSSPNAMVWAVKPAEDGIDKGVIFRLWNVASSAQQVDVSLVPTALSVQRVSHIETPIESVPLTGNGMSASLSAQQLQTYQVTLNTESTGDGDDTSTGCSGNARFGSLWHSRVRETVAPVGPPSPAGTPVAVMIGLGIVLISLLRQGRQ